MLVYSSKFYNWLPGDRKSFENNAAEKIKSDKYDPVRIMKYTDIVQSRKMHIKDDTLIMTEATEMLNFNKRRHKNARPPSKSLAGIRFIIAKNREEILKKSTLKGK